MDFDRWSNYDTHLGRLKDNRMIAQAYSTQTFTPPTDSSADWVLWVSDGSNLNAGTNFPSPGAAITRVVVVR